MIEKNFGKIQRLRRNVLKIAPADKLFGCEACRVGIGGGRASIVIDGTLAERLVVRASAN